MQKRVRACVQRACNFPARSFLRFLRRASHFDLAVTPPSPAVEQPYEFHSHSSHLHRDKVLVANRIDSSSDQHRRLPRKRAIRASKRVQGTVKQKDKTTTRTEEKSTRPAHPISNVRNQIANFLSSKGDRRGVEVVVDLSMRHRRRLSFDWVFLFRTGCRVVANTDVTRA